jgi:hypothetical protein
MARGPFTSTSRLETAAACGLTSSWQKARRTSRSAGLAAAGRRRARADASALAALRARPAAGGPGARRAAAGRAGRRRNLAPPAPTRRQARARLARAARWSAVALVAAGIVAASVLLPVSRTLRTEAPQQLVPVRRRRALFSRKETHLRVRADPPGPRRVSSAAPAARRALPPRAESRRAQPPTAPRPSLRLLAAWAPGAPEHPGSVRALLPPGVRRAVVAERAVAGLAPIRVLELASEAALALAEAALANATGASRGPPVRPPARRAGGPAAGRGAAPRERFCFARPPSETRGARGAALAVLSPSPQGCGTPCATSRWPRTTG